MRELDPPEGTNLDSDRGRGIGNRNPRSNSSGDILRRARHLGYLKAEKPTGPVVEAYQSWCYRLGRPMVLLYPYRVNSAAVVYRLPDPRKALTPCAVDLLRRRTQLGLCPGRKDRQVICRGGGEILGLDPKKAEAVAFWIADYALSTDRTEPLTAFD